MPDNNALSKVGIGPPIEPKKALAVFTAPRMSPLFAEIVILAVVGVYEG